MNLAIFDLDHTLLAGDSDFLWGQYLVEHGLVDGKHYARENQRFYDEYRAGTLDIREFLQFSLKPLAEHPQARLLELRQHFVRERILPIVSLRSRELLRRHREAGHTLLIITATNRFVTEPIATDLGVDDLIATELEIIDGRITGNVAGIPSFREGKVQRLHQWLTENGANLARSWFYSDSHNDLPLLEQVTHPVAVDPDDTLAQHAAMKLWPVISLRDTAPLPSLADLGL